MDIHVWYGTIVATVQLLLITILILWESCSKANAFKLFGECFSGISDNTLFKVPLDGPNDNLLFLDILEDDRKDSELSQHC